MMLTKTQINKIKKAINNGTGLDIKISKSHIRKSIKQGGNLFSALLPLVRTALPMVGKTLGLSALAGLASEGASQVVKKITGGFIIPPSNLEQLIPYGNLLTKKQRDDILKALNTSKDLAIKLTPKQQKGGFLGSLLAGIGIPMLISALTGKGLRVDKGKGLQVDKRRQRNTIPVYVPENPPPFYGSWENPVGYGLKKKFLNKPLSNIDLEKWIKHFGIKHFRGIFSRDNLPMKIKNKECGIINLDDTIGPGTHWVWYRNDEISEYLDPFGLTLPKEVENI